MNKILLIGDNCTDIFIYGDCYRLNPEAPTAVLSETYKIENSGMAGNVLKNIKTLGLDADFITHSEKIIKKRYVDEKSNYILLRIDNDHLIEPLKNVKNIKFSKYDLVIISDYDKGFLNKECLQFIFKKSKLSFMDTKKDIGPWLKDISFLKINEAEYKNPKNDLDFIISKRFEEKLIVTLGDKGSRYKGKLYTPPKEIMVRDVAGAGDSFLASLSCHYFLYYDIEKAIEFANLCAGQVVSKKGVAYPDEILMK